MTRLIAFLAVALVACTTREQLAAQLQQATTADRLPELAACWETEFEAAGFRGAYLAVVDFVVDRDGVVRDVKVSEILDNSTPNLTPAYEAGVLKTCIRDTLEGKHLGKMTPDRDLTVTGYRIAFGDASEQARTDAADSGPVLIGPRRNRCMGLYGYDPPRDATLLQGELARSMSDADRSRSGDQNKHARALQESWDLAVELRDRLRRDYKRDGVPKENRDRLREERRRITKLAREIGDKINCQDLP